MSVKESILKEIEHLPDIYIEKVLGFIRFLKKSGSLEKTETAIASESSLEKDWLKPEENEAWRNL